MPAKPNDQSSFDGGDLSQDLIDAMLNGGDLGPVEADPWSDSALQAEIDAARAAAGVMTSDSDSPFGAAMPVAPSMMPDLTPMPTAPAPGPSMAPTAVHPVQF